MSSDINTNISSNTNMLSLRCTYEFYSK